MPDNVIHLDTVCHSLTCPLIYLYDVMHACCGQNGSTAIAQKGSSLCESEEMGYIVENTCYSWIAENTCDSCLTGESKPSERKQV